MSKKEYTNWVSDPTEFNWEEDYRMATEELSKKLISEIEMYEYKKPLNSKIVDKNSTIELEGSYMREQLKKRSQEEFNNAREKGKRLVGPSCLMEIFGHALQIGKEKGYEDGSWWDKKYNISQLLSSAKRHFIDYENGKDRYYEKDKNGNDCPTQAVTIYQLAWNVLVMAMYEYYKIEGVDDRKFKLSPDKTIEYIEDAVGNKIKVFNIEAKLEDPPF